MELWQGSSCKNHHLLHKKIQHEEDSSHLQYSNRLLGSNIGSFLGTHTNWSHCSYVSKDYCSMITMVERTLRSMELCELVGQRHSQGSFHHDNHVHQTTFSRNELLKSLKRMHLTYMTHPPYPFGTPLVNATWLPFCALLPFPILHG
jgi:hypothetical protein